MTLCDNFSADLDCVPVDTSYCVTVMFSDCDGERSASITVPDLKTLRELHHSGELKAVLNSLMKE